MKKLLLGLVVATSLLFGAVGQVQAAASLTLSQAFTVASINYGETTTLALTLTNNGDVPLTNVQLNDTLPLGVAPSFGSTGSTCNGTTSFSGGATPGGGGAEIRHTGTSLPVGSSCLLNILVAGRQQGTFTNSNVVIGSLQTGSSTSPTTATLQINLKAPVVTKTFSPTVVNVGQVTTMTIVTTDPNHLPSSNGPLFSVSIVDNLPPGLVVADDPKVNVNIGGDAACALGVIPGYGVPPGGSPGVVGATPGSTSITFNPLINEFGRCTQKVDLKATQAGTLTNTTQAPTTGAVTAPGLPANATLTSLAPNAPCINAQLTSGPASNTLVVNTQMGFNASANCPTTPEYKWWVGKELNGIPQWVPVTLYTPNNIFYWTPTETGVYHIAFWVQKPGGSPNTNDTYAEVVRTVVAPTPCTNATLTSNPAGANLVFGNSMTFTAGATCGGTPMYRWYTADVVNGVANWRLAADYAVNANTFTWTPTALGTYYVAFWVQNAGGSPNTNDTWNQLLKNVVNPPPCTNGDLIANPSSPSVNPGTGVVFTASAQCSGIPEYRWWVAQVVNGAPNWVPVTNYGPSNTFTWTPTTPGTYFVAFWAQNRGSNPWTMDTSNQMQRTVTAPQPCASTGLTSNPQSASVSVNSPVTFAATATCSGAQYRWWVAKVVNGVPQWTPATAYGPSNLFTWTPTSAGTYFIAFWVQRSGGGEWTYDAVDQVQRTVNTAQPCVAGGLTSSPPGPNATLNTPVTFTATATCGGAAQYRWWVARIVNGVPQWTPATAYGPSNQYVWTPTVAGIYLIAYWVEGQGGGEWSYDSLDQVQRIVP